MIGRSQSPPSYDGQVQIYETPLRLDPASDVRTWYRPERRAVFINGQCNSGRDHQLAAQAISLLQMCPVVGVFNASSGLIADTIQSVGDKSQFHRPFGGGPDRYFDSSRDRTSRRTGLAPDPVESMRVLLDRNPATRSLFDLLLANDQTRDLPPGTPFYAHSQGNLVLSNALTALSVVNGPHSVAGIEVHSFGSPTINWPTGINHHDHAFTGDLVALLNPVPSFRIAKVGLPTGVKPWGFVSHSFLLYLNDDAQFVINRFRWGGWGVTFNMDEDGLADALVAMADNEPRVRKIFERLDTKHSSDADDVALSYVKKMSASPENRAVLKRMKVAPKAGLVPLLIRLTDEGWTSGEEKKVIDWLKNL